VARVSAGGTVSVSLAPGDRWLTTAEVAALVGITAGSWRSLVNQGYAPEPDDPDLSTAVNRRTRRWLLSTVLRWQRDRPSASWKRRGRAGE
jgi:hypothetical protein